MPNETKTEDTALQQTPTDLDMATLSDIQPVTERPASLESSVAGTEDIGTEDVRLPRLALAQGLSPQLNPGETVYLPDLKLFDMFNDVTGDTYRRGPITFVPLRRDVRRIEFLPRALGGGVVDMEVPAADPRMRWTVEDGKRIPPRATLFEEYVVLLLVPGKAPEPIVLSIKHTNKWNRNAAKNLDTYIKMRASGGKKGSAIYSGMYTVASGDGKNDKGTFAVYVVKNKGFIPTETPGGAALYDYAKTFATGLEGKEIVTTRETDDTDFDTEAMETESTSASMGKDPGM